MACKSQYLSSSMYRNKYEKSGAFFDSKIIKILNNSNFFKNQKIQSIIIQNKYFNYIFCQFLWQSLLSCILYIC